MQSSELAKKLRKATQEIAYVNGNDCHNYGRLILPKSEISSIKEIKHVKNLALGEQSCGYIGFSLYRDSEWVILTRVIGYMMILGEAIILTTGGVFKRNEIQEVYEVDLK